MMGAPQVIWVVVMCLGLGIIMDKNGQAKEGEYSAGTSAITLLLEAALLWWGGFFG